MCEEIFVFFWAHLDIFGRSHDLRPLEKFSCVSMCDMSQVSSKWHSKCVEKTNQHIWLLGDEKKSYLNKNFIFFSHENKTTVSQPTAKIDHRRDFIHFLFLYIFNQYLPTSRWCYITMSFYICLQFHLFTHAQVPL